MSAEVFISYASQDRERIIDLVKRLDAAGVSVWIDQMSIEGATMWSQEIVAPSMLIWSIHTDTPAASSRSTKSRIRSRSLDA